MGVPAFFKWLSTKYEKIVVDCIEERATWTEAGERVPVDTSKPNPNGFEYDNLYLDMNGIIHPASHPEDRPPPETEDDMYLAIFDYLERVFAAVRPRKLLFMAVDGVAPRAKMNQQRARRFRAAQEAQEKEEVEERLREEWAKEGREMPPKSSKQPFDSNVITPGTPFMDRLALFLRDFTNMKLSTDPGWRNIRVILSDGSVPGEGEHKIMEYIRAERQQPGYDPNTRHAIHGLDADLIMLSLATHEPHFSILREYVGPAGKRGGGGGGQNVDLATQIENEILKKAEQEAEGKTSAGDAPEAGGAKNAAPTPFQFLHISTLREYLYKEFVDCDYTCVGGYQPERAIDDFIFMCFFVGNDFLPHLPSLEIRMGAIDTLCDLYKTIFPKLGGFICEGGRVDQTRAKLFCTELGGLEDELLARQRTEEEKEKEKKRRREREVENKEGGKRHRDMLQRVAEIATVPRASQHLKNMRGEGGGGGASGADDDRAARRMAAEQALGRDAAILIIFDQIKAFSELPDNAPAERLPLNLNGYQRAMTHQYCEELGVSTEKRGKDPHAEMWLVKKGDGANESAASRFKRELDGLIKQRNTFEAEEDQVMLGVPGWKQRYYQRKFMGLDEEGCAAVASSYVEGLCWVMRYYYEGCCSWTWFYPYHYAPFAADIAAAINPDEEAAFDLGRPFKPYEQLMGVLPPRSSHALPEAFAELMKDPNSELADFYPTDFALDLNGKKFAWQAVVLLPFIDEERLLSATDDLMDTLTPDERRRNTHGEAVMFASASHAAFALMVDVYGPPPKPSSLLNDGVIFGTVRPLPSNEAPPPHRVHNPPEFRGTEAERALKPFHNLAVRATFALPKFEASSVPTLLPGLTPPRTVLTEHDVPVVKHGSYLSARRGGGGGKGFGRGGGGGGGAGRGGGYRRIVGDNYAVDEHRVMGMLEERTNARMQRDYSRADRIRDELRAVFAVEISDDQRTWWATRPTATSSCASSPPGSPPLSVGSGPSPPHTGGAHPHHYPPYPPAPYGYPPAAAAPPYHHGPPPPRHPPAAPQPPQAYGSHHLPPAGMMYNPQQQRQQQRQQQHTSVPVPSHLMPGGQQQHRQPASVTPFGRPAAPPSRGPDRHAPQDNRYHPYGRNPAPSRPAPGGVGHSQAADLLRQQVQQQQHQHQPRAPAQGGAQRPGGASAELNRSAADLLRKSLRDAK